MEAERAWVWLGIPGLAGAFAAIHCLPAMRVLVVDDHPETRQLLTRNLEGASHGVKKAATCADAEAALAAGRFDVVVLDVMLPDGSGVDLCRRLRSGQVSIPILLLTARG